MPVTSLSSGKVLQLHGLCSPIEKHDFACWRVFWYTCAGIASVGDGCIRRGGELAFEIASNGGGLYADGAGVAGQLGGPEVTAKGQRVL